MLLEVDVILVVTILFDIVSCRRQYPCLGPNCRNRHHFRRLYQRSVNTDITPRQVIKYLLIVLTI